LVPGIPGIHRIPGIMITTGRLELIIGNMFSGKSTELIRRINREQSISKRILIINYISDNRYSSENVISTHNSLHRESMKIKRISEIEKIIEDYDSIFIDEGQFFEDLGYYVIKFVDFYNKHVVVSGLDGDSNRNNFGQILDLIPKCDSVDKLSAYCKICNNSTLAPFTKRITGNIKSEVIDIGGTDKYIPVCRRHYHLEY